MINLVAKSSRFIMMVLNLIILLIAFVGLSPFILIEFLSTLDERSEIRKLDKMKGILVEIRNAAWGK